MILNVDIDIPDELHDYFNDYPLMPENTNFKPSKYMCDYADKYNILTNTRIKKLIPNLYNKRGYLIHYLNLKQALLLGCKLVKINTCFSFKQEPILKPYIDYCYNKRKECDINNNNDGKAYWKMMMNIVYGKMLENLMKRIDIKLINGNDVDQARKQFHKLVNKPNFKDVNIFDNIASIEMGKTEVEYNRPILIGFTILELSKYIMYNFHYNTMKEHFKDNINLLYTDTDSLIYEIFTDDIYDFMNEKRDLFDTSKFNKNHKLYNKNTASQLGLFKPENADNIITEFIGLKAKSYSYMTDEENKKNKGVPEHIVRNQITINDYRNVLYDSVDELKEFKYQLIQSKKHNLYTINAQKVGLSAYDDKRYILDDGINTLSHGHYSIKT